MISIPQLLIIAVIIALLFGTKRLRTLGSDLGEAIKGFKKSVKEDGAQTPNAKNLSDATLKSEAPTENNKVAEISSATDTTASATPLENKDDKLK